MSDVLLPPPAHAGDQSPKRSQILDAATDLFLAQGYGAVSMDAVARVADVSKATLYKYFASKAALFATIICDRGLNAKLDERLYPDHVDDLRAALERIGMRIMEFMMEERTLALYRIIIAESARSPDLGHAFYNNGPAVFQRRVDSWFAAQQARGLIRPADVSVASQQFMALLRSGVFLRATLGIAPAPTAADIVATVTAAVDTWLRAFGTEVPPERSFAAPNDCA
jgi:TetR/AcrR family transcriptional repressor of mexJK operon